MKALSSNKVTRAIIGHHHSQSDPKTCDGNMHYSIKLIMTLSEVTERYGKKQTLGTLKTCVFNADWL